MNMSSGQIMPPWGFASRPAPAPMMPPAPLGQGALAPMSAPVASYQCPLAEELSSSDAESHEPWSLALNVFVAVILSTRSNLAERPKLDDTRLTSLHELHPSITMTDGQRVCIRDAINKRAHHLHRNFLVQAMAIAESSRDIEFHISRSSDMESHLDLSANGRRPSDDKLWYVLDAMRHEAMRVRAAMVDSDLGLGARGGMGQMAFKSSAPATREPREPGLADCIPDCVIEIVDPVSKETSEYNVLTMFEVNIAPV